MSHIQRSKLLIKSYSQANYLGDRKEYHDSFRSAFEYAAIGMALVSPVGAWVEVNRSLCQMFGYSAEELCKMDFQAVTHPDYLEADLEYVNKMLRKEIDYYEMEKIYIHKDGKEIWGLLSVSLVFDEDEEPKYFISQIQDITDRKEAEKKIDKYMKDLEASNEQLEEFAHIVSHDLKEPLRGVSNFASFIEEDYPEKMEDGIIKKLISQRKLVDRMYNLLNNLLYYAKVGNSEMQFSSCSPKEILAEALDSISSLIDKNVQICVGDMPEEIYCNKDKIREVFQNLIGNAIRYNLSDIKKILVGFDNKEKVYYVEDNGVGIKPEFSKRIFQIFKKAHSDKRLPKGTGIGLSIVKKIIERHMGSIDFKPSQFGTGTKFFFSIHA